MIKSELLRAIRVAFDKWETYDKKENTPATFCNMFVREVMTACGYEGLANMRANDIHRKMVAESNNDKGRFVRIPPQSLSEVLNDEHEASVIVASKPNMDGPGHVCILLPGDFVYSGKWQKQVPLCANIGATNFWNKGVNYAFRVEPEYFKLVV